MSWQSALARAQRDLRREENRIALELERVRSNITRLTALSGGDAARGGKATTRKLSPEGRAAIIHHSWREEALGEVLRRAARGGIRLPTSCKRRSGGAR